MHSSILLCFLLQVISDRPQPLPNHLRQQLTCTSVACDWCVPERATQSRDQYSIPSAVCMALVAHGTNAHRG